MGTRAERTALVTLDLDSFNSQLPLDPLDSTRSNNCCTPLQRKASKQINVYIYMNACEMHIHFMRAKTVRDAVQGYAKKPKSSKTVSPACGGYERIRPRGTSVAY